VIYEIDSELLSRLEDKHALARLVAIHSAAINDRIEQEIQSELRRKMSECPNPTSQDAINRAEQDRTTRYVPGVRGRRTITLGSERQEVKPLDPAPETQSPKLVVSAESFWMLLLNWLKACPLSARLRTIGRLYGVR
jgi:hypothetical protein